MSNENQALRQEVEQITKNPLPTKSGAKEKDPKKVAAGKKLAEYNRKAKEALAREMKREADRSPEETTEEGTEGHLVPNRSQAWIPELSFTTVLSLVGIGFTALDMYMRLYKTGDRAPPTSSKEGEAGPHAHQAAQQQAGRAPGSAATSFQAAQAGTHDHQAAHIAQPPKIPVATTPKIGML